MVFPPILFDTRSATVDRAFSMRATSLSCKARIFSTLFSTLALLFRWLILMSFRFALAFMSFSPFHFNVCMSLAVLESGAIISSLPSDRMMLPNCSPCPQHEPSVGTPPSFNAFTMGKMHSSTATNFKYDFPVWLRRAGTTKGITISCPCLHMAIAHRQSPTLRSMAIQGSMAIQAAQSRLQCVSNLRRETSCPHI